MQEDQTKNVKRFQPPFERNEYKESKRSQQEIFIIESSIWSHKSLLPEAQLISAINYAKIPLINN